MTEFWRDVKFGARLLSRSPVFTLTAILLLAIGISANTLIFSVVDAILLRPLPVPHPEQLVRLIEVHSTGFVNWTFPYDVCDALAARDASLSEVICQGEIDAAFSEGSTSERVRVNLISPNFFRSLGAHAYFGRLLRAEDEQSRSMNAVLSYDFWHRRFQGDRAIVGRKVTMQGQPFTIVGVTPSSFNGLDADTSPDVRIPASVDRSIVAPVDTTRPGVRWTEAQIFARLRPGVSFDRADAEVESLLRASYEEQINRWYKLDGVNNASRLRFESVSNGVSTLRTQFSQGLRVLMAGVGLLLIMACANVAGLLLARSAVRAQEMGIRLALGASVSRLARQLLTESLIIALLGGIVGTLLTYACLPFMLGALPPIRDRRAAIQPLAIHIDIDLRVLAFAVGTTLITALLCGLSPALRGARTDLTTTLRAGRTSTRRLYARNLIVVAQVALCTVILTGAALLVETLDRMRAMNPGFDSDRIVTFTIDPRMRGYTAGQSRSLSLKLLEQTRALPSVAAASIAGRGVMRGTGFKATYAAAGTPISSKDFLNCSGNQVMPGYFETMGIRVIGGRDFTWFDHNENPATRHVIIIVNETFARRFFPGKDPIGQHVGAAGPDGIAKPDWQIVGVVSDAKYRSLREPIPPTVYNPMVDGSDYEFVLNVRTRQHPEAIIGAVRGVLRSLDPEMPFIEVRALREEVEISLWQERLLAGLSSIFGAIAALLAAIGLYGALDYAVKSRTREIGIRSALGAEPAHLASLLCRETLLLVTTGLALGLVAYAVSAAWIHRVLYDVRSWNLLVIGLAVLFIIASTALAAALPIWRGIRIEPATALRQE